jgi:thioredoxin 1
MKSAHFRLAPLLDLGSTCKTCRMMAPLLDELAEEYAGRAEVIFIDLAQHPEKAKEFNVSIKPTQIFFDRTGKEITRHQGFLGKFFMANILDNLLGEVPEVATP